MTHPIQKPIEFATDATWTTGPELGQPTRVASDPAQDRQGMIGGNAYPAAKFNYQLGVMADYIRAMSENHLRGWDPVNVPAGELADNNVIHGIFAYARGAERVPRVHVFGANSTQTTIVTTWFRTQREWGGQSWSPNDDGSIREMAATPDGSILVGVGLSMGNKVGHSTDGTIFIKANTHGAFNYRSVCFHDGAFYAVPETGTTIGKSTNGSTWTATAADPGGAQRFYARSGKTTGGVPCVLVASGTQSWISTNGGVSWLAGPASAFDANDIQYSAGAGLWMAVSNLLAVYVSADGLNWAQVRTASIPSGPGFNQGVETLATDGGGAWVVGGNSIAGESPGAFVAYSVDNGESWRGETLDNADSQRVQVCYSAVEARFYAVTHHLLGGRQPQVFRSPAYGRGGGLVV
jgi:hypothetical protein